MSSDYNPKEASTPLEKFSYYIGELKRFRHQEGKAIDQYMIRDNMNNLLIVCVFMFISYIIRIMTSLQGVSFPNRGTEALIVSIFYIPVWFLFHFDFMDNDKLRKAAYVSFWVIVNVIGLRYVQSELRGFHSVSYFVILMFIFCTFYIGSLPGCMIMIGTDCLAAVHFIGRTTMWDKNKSLFICVIFSLSLMSLAISQYRYFSFVRDIRARMALKDISEVDRLTNLMNRRGMDQKLGAVWPLLKDTQKIVWAIMIDIDYFKSYNDTYGHIGGDQCLKQVSSCIYHAVCQDTAFIVRYGGEEIVVILTNATEDESTAAAEKIRSRVEKLNIKPGSASPYSSVTVSIGVAGMLASHRISIYDIIDKADEQLYYSKKNGRNMISVHGNVMEIKNENVWS